MKSHDTLLTHSYWITGKWIIEASVWGLQVNASLGGQRGPWAAQTHVLAVPGENLDHRELHSDYTFPDTRILPDSVLVKGCTQLHPPETPLRPTAALLLHIQAKGFSSPHISHGGVGETSLFITQPPRDP